jgi:hypothetical protein
MPKKKKTPAAKTQNCIGGLNVSNQWLLLLLMPGFVSGTAAMEGVDGAMGDAIDGDFSPDDIVCMFMEKNAFMEKNGSKKRPPPTTNFERARAHVPVLCRCSSFHASESKVTKVDSPKPSDVCRCLAQ